MPGLFQYQVYRALCIVCTEGYRASYRGRVFLVLEGPLSYDGRGLDLPEGSQLNHSLMPSSKHGNILEIRKEFEIWLHSEGL